MPSQQASFFHTVIDPHLLGGESTHREFHAYGQKAPNDFPQVLLATNRPRPPPRPSILAVDFEDEEEAAPEHCCAAEQSWAP
ncbi:MAG: hypothetical protein WBV90_00395 [Terrimicrobiaceae bacterium]